MRGFAPSVEFDRAVDTLMKLQELDGLQNGYAIFDADLELVDWHKVEWDADEVIGAGRSKVKVPDLDWRYAAEAALLAGLTYTWLSDRHMIEAARDGSIDASVWVEGENRVEHHLFGGDGCARGRLGLAPEMEE